MESGFDFSVCFSMIRANNDYLEMFFDYLDMPSDMHYGKSRPKSAAIIIMILSFTM